MSYIYSTEYFFSFISKWKKRVRLIKQTAEKQEVSKSNTRKEAKQQNQGDMLTEFHKIRCKTIILIMQKANSDLYARNMLKYPI